MVIENITSIILPEEVVKDLSFLATLFQAVGGLILAYIIFSIINLILGKKKEQELKRIRELLEEINKKLGKKK
jgi:hypothetical protein